MVSTALTAEPTFSRRWVRPGHPSRLAGRRAPSQPEHVAQRQLGEAVEHVPVLAQDHRDGHQQDKQDAAPTRQHPRPEGGDAEEHETDQRSEEAQGVQDPVDGLGPRQEEQRA